MFYLMECFSVNYLTVNLMLFYKFPDRFFKTISYIGTFYTVLILIKKNPCRKNINYQLTFKQLTQNNNGRTTKTQLLPPSLKLPLNFISDFNRLFFWSIYPVASHNNWRFSGR